LSGISLRQIARDWNAIGLRTSTGAKEFTSREVRKILLRHRNAGISLHEGQPVAQGLWEKILDTETFHEVEHLLKSRRGVGFERKHQGSGIYRCGKCGATMVGTRQNKTADGWRPTYACSRQRHLCRDVEHLDAFVDGVVMGVLFLPDAAKRLGVIINLDEVRDQERDLRARLDDLTKMFTTGEIDGGQLQVGSKALRAQLDAVEGRLAAARSSSELANLILAGDDRRAAWDASPPAVRGPGDRCPDDHHGATGQKRSASSASCR
jgi:site-specific DNA recombinase